MAVRRYIMHISIQDLDLSWIHGSGLTILRDVSCRCEWNRSPTQTIRSLAAKNATNERMRHGSRGEESALNCPAVERSKTLYSNQETSKASSQAEGEVFCLVELIKQSPRPGVENLYTPEFGSRRRTNSATPVRELSSYVN